MSLDLIVQDAIAVPTQVVKDEAENPSALNLATAEVMVSGRDVVGGSLPVRAQGNTSIQEFDNGTTWGRVLRLQDAGTSNQFYDIGIDRRGNLFVNSRSSTQSDHVLTISPNGAITLNAANGLTFSGLPRVSGSNVVDLVIDRSTGRIGHQ